MSPACPFCKIAAAHPPVAPSAHQPTDSKPSILTPTPGEDGHAFLALSTRNVLAFLDIMPLTRGHILVVPRRHYEKLTEVGVGVSRELGIWLPILSRAVMRTVFGGSQSQNTDGTSTTDPSWNWNVVQNNGAGAAQVVPHVHFHIVPRPPSGAVGTAAKMSFVMFGRGKREDLDDEQAEKLAADLRVEIAREVKRVREVEGVDLEAEAEGYEGEGKGML
ncbi:HIT-like domain-containing protein [Aspergillus desertorum]